MYFILFLAESFITFYKCQERWKKKKGGGNLEKVWSIYLLLSLDSCIQETRMIFVNKWHDFGN